MKPPRTPLAATPIAPLAPVAVGCEPPPAVQEYAEALEPIGVEAVLDPCASVADNGEIVLDDKDQPCQPPAPCSNGENGEAVKCESLPESLDVIERNAIGGHLSAVDSNVNGQEQRDVCSGYTILTPAGKCPIAWGGSLNAWLDAVEVQCPAGRRYAPSALRHWLRQVIPAAEYPGLVRLLG